MPTNLPLRTAKSPDHPHLKAPAAASGVTLLLVLLLLGALSELAFTPQLAEPDEISTETFYGP
jgi:hypothetical protein